MACNNKHLLRYGFWEMTQCCRVYKTLRRDLESPSPTTAWRQLCVSIYQNERRYITEGGSSNMHCKEILSACAKGGSYGESL